MKSTGNNKYDLIGKIAVALYGQSIQISLDALKQILNDSGESYSDVSNLGLGKSVSAAYGAWEKVDPVIHHAIAATYVGRDGQKPWVKYYQ